ncbi:MAG: PH domain-containing protein [Synergistaceae bacterium]|jgi:uncharacterized membrane protein YdbT with pleckstrin-like domain|nr:PH domain-containing protein [Synergistaceae bacterium]
MGEQNVDKQNVNEQKYRPAWRSFYPHVAAMVACLALVSVLSAKLPLSWAYKKWLWVFFLAFALYAFLDMARRRFRVVLIVRPDEIAMEEGLIGRHSIEISTKSVRSIQVRQRVLQRLLKTGSIIVTSSGDNEEISVSDMPDPYAIREAMQAYERAENGEKVEALPAPTGANMADETKEKSKEKTDS